MESDHGDLGDIIRGGTVNSSTEWRIHNESIDFPTITDESDRRFSDTFSIMRVPLLHELEFANSTAFNAQDLTTFVNSNSIDVHGFQNSLQPKTSDDQTRRPEYDFSRMFQMSPERIKISPSPAFSLPNYGSLVVNGTSKVNNSSSTSVEKGGNMPKAPGTKRRKNQAKKVVCIPAPSPTNSRPTGEVVPSDHWAWRKYGQKPIKGSPYPRGYYRCSSSKGCSARKQVERSRSDPNMLVVTYTSEHNHPWPTQRNSLAGSTRSQNRKLNSSSKISSSSHNEKIAEKKVEELSNQIGKHFVDTSNKGEVGKFQNSTDIMEDHLSDQNSAPSYKPFHIASINSDDFFADLGEFESDPLQVAFSQGLSTGK